MKIICPKDPTHDRFITTGVEYHDWIVNANSDFIDDKGCFEARLGEGGYECATCRCVAEVSNAEQ